MKTMMLVLALFSQSLASAATPLSLEEAVARNIQALINDTVNEGHQTAEVIYQAGRPQMLCKIDNSRVSASEKWAFCGVAFLVQSEELRERRRCFLLYRFDPRNIEASLRQGNERTFQDCLQILNQSVE